MYESPAKSGRIRSPCIAWPYYGTSTSSNAPTSPLSMSSSVFVHILIHQYPHPYQYSYPNTHTHTHTHPSIIRTPTLSSPIPIPSPKHLYPRTHPGMIMLRQLFFGSMDMQVSVCLSWECLSLGGDCSLGLGWNWILSDSLQSPGLLYHLSNSQYHSMYPSY